MQKDILIIDYGTSGYAGLYIDEIVSNLDKKENVEVAVSYYFPFRYGKRIFCKYSELCAQKRYNLGRARLYIRFIELSISYLRLFFYVLFSRIRVTCYALSSNLFLEYMFLFVVKYFTKSKVYIICHDVVPFVGPREKYEKKLMDRNKFYKLAHLLIVHNNNSIEDLSNVFKISAKKIRMFPFPVFNMRKISIPIVDILKPSNKMRFLFIGHLRIEKGIDVLIEAWSKFYVKAKNVELVIAGNIPTGSYYNFDLLLDKDLVLFNHYLSDSEYFNLIRQSYCIVLPYLRGTNSGIPSTVLSENKNLIVSDIGMFKNNNLIPSISFFKSGNSEDLVEKLVYFYKFGKDGHIMSAKNKDKNRKKYDIQFKAKVNEVFN